MDKYFNFDMQKDNYVNKINTVELDPDKNNNVIKIDNIEYTIIYDKENNKLTQVNGYLDIGLKDTMDDLIVNFLGAIIYSIFGYLYMTNKNIFKLIEKLKINIKQ